MAYFIKYQNNNDTYIIGIRSLQKILRQVENPLLLVDFLEKMINEHKEEIINSIRTAVKATSIASFISNFSIVENMFDIPGARNIVKMLSYNDLNDPKKTLAFDSYTAKFNDVFDPVCIIKINPIFKENFRTMIRLYPILDFGDNYNSFKLITRDITEREEDENEEYWLTKFN